MVTKKITDLITGLYPYNGTEYVLGIQGGQSVKLVPGICLNVGTGDPYTALNIQPTGGSTIIGGNTTITGIVGITGNTNITGTVGITGNTNITGITNLSDNVGIGTVPASKLDVQLAATSTQNAAWFKNYSGTKTSPTEASDWPWSVLALSGYGNYYRQNMLSFTLPNDATTPGYPGIYHSDNSVWNISLNGVTGVNSWDNASGSITPATSSSSEVGLQLLGPGNLRLGTDGAKNLYLRTNGVDRVTIDPTGIVNIPAGKLYTSGTVIQTVNLKVDTKATYTYPAGTSTGTIIPDLNLSITPYFATSKVLVQYNIAFEVDHNTVFRLFRSINGAADVEIGKNSSDANYWSGIWNTGYDADNASTPRQNHYMYLDSPATNLPIAYKLMIQSSTTTGSTFYLNRSVSSAGAASYEVATSHVLLQEIA